MVACVGHNNIAVPVHRQSTGAVEAGDSALSVSMALLASARYCGYHALRTDLADAMVVHIAHYDVALPVHRHSIGPLEKSPGRPCAVLTALLAGARQRGYRAYRHELESMQGVACETDTGCT
eukprot:1182267-Prorocentrum_minimum.AAC.2